MPAPTTIPQWDSNRTHVTPLVASHKTDGFVTNEIPASDELNEWMNWVYQWLLYLSTRTTTKRKISAIAGEPLTGGSFNIAGEYFPSSTSDILVIPILLNTGERMTALSGVVSDTSFSAWEFKAWKLTAPGAAVQLGTTQTSGSLGTGTAQTLTVSGLNETMLDSDHTRYIVTFQSTGVGVTSNKVFYATPTFDVPAW
jgi:hypothetical protein